MTELEKIQYTKSFIDKLANGINPLNGEPIPDNDLLNNVRISRCMFYVSGILDNICNELSNPAPKKKIRNADKPCFSISNEKLLQFEYDESGVYVGNIARKLNALIDLSVMQKIKVRAIFDWLVDNKLLYVSVSVYGKEQKRTTDEGKQIGLSEELKISENGGTYIRIICNKKAQQYIVEHSNIIAESDKKSEKLEYQGKPWEPEQDKQLVTMFKDGLVVAEIAKELKRTSGAIRARLVKLGLINNRSDIN